MDDNKTIAESLLDKAAEYGKISFELIKLKVLDKVSDVISTLASHSLALVLIGSFMLFLNLGIAFWLGELLGKISYGLLLVASFYGTVGIIALVFMSKWTKRAIGNYIIKLLLK